MKRPISLFLLLSIMMSIAACGNNDSPDSTQDSTTAITDESKAPEKAVYPYYEGKDLDGKTINVLNVAKYQYDMISYIEPDEITGETVNDAIHNRNTYVENMLNYNINEVNEPDIDNMGPRVQKMVLSGDNEFDVVFMPMYQITSGISNGYYQVLNDFENLHLDEYWWDQQIINDTSILNKNYFASSAVHLMGYEGLWCIYFNEQMMDSHGLEYPYQLVLDGKWTLDKLSEYCKAAANLNGDENFNVGNDKCIWGMSSFNNCVMKFVYGLGGNYIGKDNNDKPVFACEDQRFIEVCQKLADFYAREGEYLNAGTDSQPEIAYTKYFKEARALFLGGEVKNAQGFRNLDWSFGIVPFPKYDESQADYRSTALHQYAVFTIPATNTEPEDAALVFDALSFESEENVIEPYFSVMVEQKGLRNEDSIDMLNIIKEARSFDIGITMMLVGNLQYDLSNRLLSGSSDVASIIAKYKPTVEDNIQKIIDEIENQT